jgi:hypothetical protein
MDLTKPKKEVKERTALIAEKIIKELDKNFPKIFNEKFKEKSDLITKEILKKINGKINTFFDKYEKQMLNELKKSNKSMENFCKQIDSIEETFLILYQNIKQNQFLYANYPEEWLKEVNDKIKKIINE